MLTMSFDAFCLLEVLLVLMLHMLSTLFQCITIVFCETPLLFWHYFFAKIVIQIVISRNPVAVSWGVISLILSHGVNRSVIRLSQPSDFPFYPSLLPLRSYVLIARRPRFELRYLQGQRLFNPYSAATVHLRTADFEGPSQCVTLHSLAKQN